MDVSRRTGLIALAGSVIGFSTPQRGRVAFHYEAVFPPAQARWYKRFSILVTGGILEPRQTEKLRTSGNRLVAYEWMSGFYPDTEASATRSWQAGLVSARSKLLLNTSPVGGGVAAAGKSAYWYDFGRPELFPERAEQLAQALAKSHFDGYFFDTLGWRHLPPEIQAKFRQAHPGLDYEQQQGLFLKEVRSRLPRPKVIFLNQGYRNPKVYLPHADLELSESLFTYLRDNGETGFRPWRNGSAPWESVQKIMSDIIMPVARQYPRVSWVHLNYADAGAPSITRQAIRYSFACAKLFNHTSYVVCPQAPALEEDESYFQDLGAPVSAVVEDDTGTVAWREFQRGVVAVNSGPHPVRVAKLNQVLSDPPQGYVFHRKRYDHAHN